MKRILTIITAALVGVSAMAQSYTGTVTTTAGEPLEAAVVCLKSPSDSTVIAYATSGKDGGFAIECKTSPVILNVSYIGFKTMERPCNDCNIGTIAMEADAEMMAASVVKAGRAVQKLTAEGMETLVSGSMLENAGTGSDVLKKVPGIVYKDKSFDVYGKGAPLIYINGRKMLDSTELEHIASEDIKSIEVIANPGARYDASVRAVVKIITRRKQGDGFSFDFMGGYHQGDKAAADGNLNLNYRKGGLDIFGTLSAARSYIHGVNGTEMKIKADTLWNQNFTQNFELDNYNTLGVIGANYVFNPTNSIGFRYSVDSDLKDGKTAGLMKSEILADGKLFDRLQNDILSVEPVDYAHSLNAYYHGRAGMLDMDINVDYTHSTPETINYYDETSEENDDRRFSTTSKTLNDMIAGKVVLSYPLWGGSLSAGAEYTRTSRTDEYITTGVLDGASNKLYENKAAPFIEYSHPLPFGMVMAGLRYENVRFDYYEAGKHMDEQSRSFGNLFPSLSFAGMAGPVQFSLAYSAKTRRPMYSQLSNTMIYGNRFLWSKGNPYLKHEYVHDIMATAVWKFVQFSANFSDRRNAILTSIGQVSEETSSIQYVTYDNFKSVKTLTVNLFATPTIGRWSITAGGQMLKQWLAIDYLGGRKKMNKPIFVPVWNNSFDLSRGWTWTLDGWVLTKGDTENNSVDKAFGGVNTAVLKTLLDGKLSLKLGVTDVFKTMGNYIRNFCGSQNLLQYSYYDSRRLEFTVKYSFNTARSKYRGTGAGNDEKSRL